MSWFRYSIAFALLMHGLAHFSGFFAAWAKADVGYKANPWLFSKNVTLKSPLGKVFGLLWPVAALALVAGGVGLALGQGWWPGAALIGAAVSLFVILPWLRSVPPGAWAGTLFDALILLSLATPWKEQVLQFLS
jgi:hypothetical protein